MAFIVVAIVLMFLFLTFFIVFYFFALNSWRNITWFYLKLELHLYIHVLNFQLLFENKNLFYKTVVVLKANFKMCFIIIDHINLVTLSYNYINCFVCCSFILEPFILRIKRFGHRPSSVRTSTIQSPTTVAYKHHHNHSCQPHEVKMQAMTCKRENILQVIARDKFCSFFLQFNITKNL